VIAEEPTVPKRMVLPCTVPLTLTGVLALENWIRPLNFDAFCFQCRVNVPWKAPPYFPDQVPVSDEAAFCACAA
jgi:hypothetical protein